MKQLDSPQEHQQRLAGHSLRPIPTAACGEPWTPQQPKPVLTLSSCTILDTHGHTKGVQAKVGPHHPAVPLCSSPARGSWEHQCHEKPASSENVWSEHGHVPQPLLRRHESRAHSFYLKTMYFAQQKPPHSTAAPQNRG